MNKEDCCVCKKEKKINELELRIRKLEIMNGG